MICKHAVADTNPYSNALYKETSLPSLDVIDQKKRMIAIQKSRGMQE